MTLFPDLPAAPEVGDELERHYTPDVLARWVVTVLPWNGIMGCVDPHAGGGAFIRAVRELQPRVHMHASDIDPTCPSVVAGDAHVADFLSVDPADCEGIDRFIGNPPFSVSEEHIEHALRIADDVAFLLPVSRLETKTRMRFYARQPLRVITLLPDRWWPGSRQVALFHFYAGVGPPVIRFAGLER